MSTLSTITAPQMTGREWAWMGVLAFVWGGSFFFIAIGLTELPVLTLVAGRCVVGALALHLILRVQGAAFPLAGSILLAFLGMSLLNNVIPFSLIAFGQSRIPSGLASILNATTPMFTMLIAHLFTKDERLTPRKVVGVVLGFCGVAILFDLRKLGAGGALEGQLACLAATISYGFAGVYGRRFARMGLSPVAIAAGQITLSSLIMVPLALAHDGVPSLPSLHVILAVLGLGILSTAGGYVLFFRILARAGATNISLVTLMVPCSAILLGAAFLGEKIGLTSFIGFGIITLGLLVVDGRILKLFSRRDHHAAP